MVEDPTRDFPPMQDRDGLVINYNDFVLIFAKIVGAGEGEIEAEVESADGTVQTVRVPANKVKKSGNPD